MFCDLEPQEFMYGFYCIRVVVPTRARPPAAQEIEVIQIHLAVVFFRAALAAGQRCGAVGSGKGIDLSPGFE
jgi:hypothetical protein